jgi:hypothetical protein
MAARVLRNITSATTSVLILKNGTINGNSINNISISNNSANSATGICVDLYDGTNVFYLIRDAVIPSGVSLILEDSLGFDTTKYSLRISNAGTSPNITVIIT